MVQRLEIGQWHISQSRRAGVYASCGSYGESYRRQVQESEPYFVARR
jgi:hypothetical protein